MYWKIKMHWKNQNVWKESRFIGSISRCIGIMKIYWSKQSVWGIQNVSNDSIWIRLPKMCWKNQIQWFILNRVTQFSQNGSYVGWLINMPVLLLNWLCIDILRHVLKQLRCIVRSNMYCQNHKMYWKNLDVLVEFCCIRRIISILPE